MSSPAKKLDFGQPLPLALDLASIVIALKPDPLELQPMIEKRTDLWLSHHIFTYINANVRLLPVIREELYAFATYLKEQV